MIRNQCHKMGLDWEAHDVLADFRECQRASQNTDLVFHCSNGHVSAHQMIFAGISPFFTDLMQRFVIGRELFPLDLNVSLPEIRREHVEMVVEIVYTGQVRITKRDYQPFREICQLLQLCVPIADYDKFFMNQGGNEDGSNSFDALDNQVQLSIPLKSPTNPQVFECDECFATFPLKIALKKHKKIQHGESESEALNPPPSPVVTETLTVEPQLNTRPTRQCRLNGSKNLVCLQNDERMVECPDCQSLFGPRQVRQHLAVHLKKELGALVMRSKSVSGVFKCQESLCSYETAVPFYMSRHLGATHDFITKFANEAQMKFLHDAEELIRKPKSLSLKPPYNLSPENKGNNLNQQPRTSQRVLENEDGPEKNNDIEPETESARKDSTERESQSFNELDELNSIELAPLNQPSNSSLNNQIPKSTQNGERAVECPDCQSLIHPSRVRYHLIIHLRKELNEFFKRSESKPDVFECQLCLYETSERGRMQRHVGVMHDTLAKFANVAQKKFLQECHDPIKPWRTRNLFNLRNINRIREKDGFLEMTDNNGEIQGNNGVQDVTNNESLPKKDERALECPDCRRLIHPVRVRHHLITHMRKKLSKHTIKSESVRGLHKCQFCSYETTCISSVYYHVGVQHKMLKKYANPAQRKFMDDAPRMLLKVTNSKKLKKPGQSVTCPDCLKDHPPREAPRHLVRHLQDQLNNHITASETIPQVFKCKLCSYEAPIANNVTRHLGLTHNMISTFANPAQKKFLQDARKLY